MRAALVTQASACQPIRLQPVGGAFPQRTPSDPGRLKACPTLILAAVLLFTASAVDDSFRAGLMALEHGDLALARKQAGGSQQTGPARWPRVGGALADLLAPATPGRCRGCRGQSGGVCARRSRRAPGADDLLLGDAPGAEGRAGAAKYSAKVPQNSDARDRAAELYFEAARPLLDQQKFAEAVAILRGGRRRGCPATRNWNWRWA